MLYSLIIVIKGILLINGLWNSLRAKRERERENVPVLFGVVAIQTTHVESERKKSPRRGA
jgi:hypothetical protein